MLKPLRTTGATKAARRAAVTAVLWRNMAIDVFLERRVRRVVVRRGVAVGGAEDIAERSLEVFSSGSGLIGFPGPRLVRRVGHVTVTWLACHAARQVSGSSDSRARDKMHCCEVLARLVGGLSIFSRVSRSITVRIEELCGR